MTTISVLHFSDILCVWAYAGQVRVEQLRRDFPDRVEVYPHCCPVFGVARRRLEESWRERGGLEGYAAHVQTVAAGFDHVEVHPDVWSKVAPPSSLPCHIFLHAVRLAGGGDDVDGAAAMERMAKSLRTAFFEDARDVSRRAVLLTLAEELDLDGDAIAVKLDSGDAHAALARDNDLVRQYDVRTSPSLIFNEGRQRLIGNVGYRVIEANVRELLERPDDGHSWC